MAAKTIKVELLHPGDVIVIWSARRRAGVTVKIKRVTVDAGTVSLTLADGGMEVLPIGTEVNVP